MSKYIEVFKRTEIKYLLDSDQYRKLFSFLEGFARVDDYGLTRINNIYFDTPNFQMIRTSLDKPLYKEKLRLRTYGPTCDSTNSFIEIKKKYDGIVYKRRISGKYKVAYDYLVNNMKPLDDSQISKEIAGVLDMYDSLRPAMRISYDRVAMAGIKDPEFRVTFDTNITWNKDVLDLREDAGGVPILEEGQYMMEIKVANAMPLELTRKLSELRIFPTSFSKYGRGYQQMMKIRMTKETARVVSRELIEIKNNKEVRAYA
ncbi:MAG: polyphosphate polymerase domain-containing protein [Eubacterium sp.]|nr:polyphosphate polymerase domain-containing protein [Eubacterium sp.]